MELNYYRVICTNNQEFIIQSVEIKTSSFLEKLSTKGLFGGNEYIVLQLKVDETKAEPDPVYLRSDKIFSVQKAREGIIGVQTKLWRIM